MSLLGIILIATSPVAGALVGRIADRFPMGSSALLARPTCGHCRRDLSIVALVPILGWPLSSGRCRYCDAHLSIYYPIVEVSAIVVAIMALAMTEDPVTEVSVLYGWILLALAAMDLLHMVLATWLCLFLAMAGLVVAGLWSQLPFGDHVLGVLLGVGTLYGVNAVYRRLRGRDGLGMGDVLLMGSAGAWVGWQGLPTVVLYAAAAALLVLLSGAAPWKTTPQTAIPFGAFLCLGMWFTWLIGPIGWSGNYA